MIKGQYVYFSGIHPDKWFETREEAEEYDAHIEVVDHVYVSLGEHRTGLPKEDIEAVIKALSDRYKIEERWEWRAKQATTEQPPIEPEDTL